MQWLRKSQRLPHLPAKKNEDEKAATARKMKNEQNDLVREQLVRIQARLTMVLLAHAGHIFLHMPDTNKGKLSFPCMALPCLQVALPSASCSCQTQTTCWFALCSLLMPDTNNMLVFPDFTQRYGQKQHGNLSAVMAEQEASEVDQDWQMLLDMLKAHHSAARLLSGSDGKGEAGLMAKLWDSQLD